MVNRRTFTATVVLFHKLISNFIVCCVFLFFNFLTYSQTEMSQAWMNLVVKIFNEKPVGGPFFWDALFFLLMPFGSSKLKWLVSKIKTFYLSPEESNWLSSGLLGSPSCLNVSNSWIVKWNWVQIPFDRPSSISAPSGLLRFEDRKFSFLFGGSFCFCGETGIWSEICQSINKKRQLLLSL